MPYKKEKTARRKKRKKWEKNRAEITGMERSQE
jgi:hypothetical protein